MIKIFCKNDGKEHVIAGGESLLEIYNRIRPELPYPALCAKVNNKTEELGFRVYSPKDVEFLDITHPSGMRTYVRSLCFVL